MRFSLSAVAAIASMSCAWSQIPAGKGYSAIGRFEADLGGRSAGEVDPVILEKFTRAIKDAEKSDPARVSHALVPLRPDNDGLIWKGDGADRRVLATTLTSYHGYDPLVHTRTELGREVWVTMGSELREFCAADTSPRERMVLRLEQLIGLNPAGRDRLVEMWIRPADLFRPAPDPEITDREAGLDFPQAGSSLQISDAHIQWINDLKAISYGPSGMPWTRLGYTYDWGNPNSILGLSEFLARQGSVVEIESVSDPAEYCQGQRSSMPPLSARDVVNFASGLGGGVAPGEWLAVGGVTISSPAGRPPARVFFDNHEASVAAFSPSRLQVLAPPDLKGRFRTDMVVEVAGVRRALTLPVLESAPGIYTAAHSGRGPVNAWNQDGSRNAEDRPAARGSIVTFWATGMGGQMVTSVRVGGEWVPTSDMVFVGPVEPGVHEIQIRIPPALAPGAAELLLTSGRSTSRRGVTVFVN